MTLKEYIETKYDIREKVATLKRDPIKEFIDSDIFPFDFIENDNGDLVKMLYYDNGNRDIAVLDLLAYRREDLVRLGDKELLKLFDSYTSQFKFDNTYEVSLDEIRKASLKRMMDKVL